MPYVRGFLRIGRRGDRFPGLPGSGTPEYPIGPEAPEEEYPEAGLPGHPAELPEPPDGIWPPLTPEHPIAPVPPNINPPVPPGSIWPPINGAPSAKFWVAAYIPGVGFKYICVDPSLKPAPVTK